MLRIDTPEQEMSLQSPLKPFVSLAEPTLLSPPLSPLPQDHHRVLSIESRDARLGPVEEATAQSDQEEMEEKGKRGSWL